MDIKELWTTHKRRFTLLDGQRTEVMIKGDFTHAITELISSLEIAEETPETLPKIAMDKKALRFTFTNGDGVNLFWEDLFVGKRHSDFQVEIMRSLFRLYNECVLDDNDVT